MSKSLNDQRVNARLDRWLYTQQEAGEPVERQQAWKPFLAGWQARLDAALEDWKAWGDDDALIRDFMAHAQKQVDRVFEDYWKMRGLLQQKQNLIDAWYLAKHEERGDRYAVRDGKADQRLVDLPLWKRISMQRKELRALHHEIAWRDALIQRQRKELEELKSSK